MIYLDLLIGFLEVGFFSFGGAYAAIPIIRDVVLAHGWLSDEMVTYMIAISESTPGPIMVNLATYVGNAKGGILGAIIAISPTYLTVSSISSLVSPGRPSITCVIIWLTCPTRRFKASA